LVKAKKIVVDFMDQAMNAGDLAVPLRDGAIKKEDIYGELGEIIAGKKKGRTDSSEITIFKATGLAIEDIATANKVYQLAKKKGIGKEI
jgi:alanine dehydrogenase